ncbi:hypothetical protein TrST_g10206 [Triparma strigata]|uniref:FAD dependent oxidoreductase domain-containing protein n=1 Tax=Triparma strigata TaxID=1606541 RepID=A0A9W7ACZ9_9STRA|nr:hypothetical protein TrST_g10206 [Triparma strigata]
MISRSLVRLQQKHVVVGGGIAGLTTAFNLLAQSCEDLVTLVEKAPDVAQGASSKNGGLLCPSLDYPWTNNSVVDIYDLNNGILPRAITSPKTSPVRFRPSSLTNTSVLDFGMNWVGRAQNSEPIGALMQYSMGLYKNEPQFAGLDFDQGLAKGTLIDGNLDERDSSGDIKKFCIGLKDILLKEHGGVGGRFRILTNKRIGKAVTEGDEVVELRVRDENLGTMSSVVGDSFVVAAGTGSKGIVGDIGVACPTVPVKGYLLTFSSTTEVTCNMKLPNKMFVAPMGVDEEDGKFIYRCSGLAEFGGAEMGVDWEGKERIVGDTDRAALDQMRGVVCEDFADVQVIDEDYGFRCLAPDDVPLIGRTKYQNLYLNTGHGSKGWTMGAGSGKLCAQLILGMQTDLDPSWYDPLRFQARKDFGLLGGGAEFGQKAKLQNA